MEPAMRTSPEARGRGGPDAQLQPATRDDGDLEDAIEALRQRQDALGRVQRQDPEHHPAGAVHQIGEQRHRRRQIAVGVVAAPRPQIAACHGQDGEGQ